MRPSTPTSPLAIDHFRYFAGAIRAEEGSISEIDIVIDGDQNSRQLHPNVHLDTPGAAGGFSLEALEDMHFTATSSEHLPSPTPERRRHEGRRRS